MSFISRLRLHSRTLISPKLTSISISRNYALAAKQEQEEEEEELEMIDQRRLPADYDPSNFDPTEHRSPPTDRVFKLVDDITSLTLIEIGELSSIIMKRLKMTQPPVIGVMKPGATAGMAVKGSAAAGGGAKEEAKVEKTVFEVKLESFEASAKIKIIKEVRSFTELGLKEAKELVEKAPAVVKGGVSKEEGEQIVEKLKALGAKVVLE